MEYGGYVILAVVSMTLFYAFLPYCLSVYFERRGDRLVSCPGTGRDAIIRLDALHAAWRAPLSDEPPLRVGACTEWPWRKQCDQRCLAAVRRPS